jgi:hypothetical protein
VMTTFAIEAGTRTQDSKLKTQNLRLKTHPSLRRSCSSAMRLITSSCSTRI